MNEPLHDFSGRFEMTTSENHDEYLKAVGVGMVTRKLASSAKPTLEIAQDGARLRITTVSTFKTVEVAFELGVEFEETTADGRNVQTVIVADGNRLVQVQKLDGLEAHITRTFTAAGLVEESKAGGAVSTRVYRRL